MNEGFTAAERCAKRLARESEADKLDRENREWSLGEQVINNKLIRDLSIRVRQAHPEIGRRRVYPPGKVVDYLNEAVDFLIEAAECGHDAMIDHLVSTVQRRGYGATNGWGGRLQIGRGGLCSI